MVVDLDVTWCMTSLVASMAAARTLCRLCVVRGSRAPTMSLAVLPKRRPSVAADTAAEMNNDKHKH